jgi:hypothetical protein
VDGFSRIANVSECSAADSLSRDFAEPVRCRCPGAFVIVPCRFRQAGGATEVSVDPVSNVTLIIDAQHELLPCGFI